MSQASPDEFYFRDLHPNVLMGTASDRYAGWIGQIYSKERYGSRISRRSKSVGGQSVTEEVLPVESVEEYFQHFSVLELDFTFYRLLLDKDLKPTQNYHVLQTYRKHLGPSDHLVLKVPQVIFAQKLWRGGKFIENPDYLDPEIFTHQFYKPATDLLDRSLHGFIFEQEYQLKKDRPSPDDYAAALGAFFERIPEDERYHVEVRTESLLSEPYFGLLEKHGIGQVLSHWTWLPPLRRQFTKGSRRFLNHGGQCVIRLMTPRGMRYEEAYLKAFPFDKLVEGMMSPHMLEDTVGIMQTAIEQGLRVDVLVNNRAGGNAPLIAQKVAENFSRALNQ
ncbi:MAG: DUF72 domain-containing protein [Desulfobacteraceae bacterium]|jgi:uncharacterized protein YecE (DUF72 family)